MGAHHNHCSHEVENNSPAYRKVLWTVMIINFVMFIVEITGGILSNSTALLADSLDFAGDTTTYTISIFVLGKHLHTRARASLFKATLMMLFGLWISGTVIYQIFSGDIPKSEVMGIIGALALIANLICAFLLYRFREGDSNVLSVWLCTRNDAIGNIAVLLAALGVYLSNSNAPDLIVASIMGYLGLSAGIRIFRHAMVELKTASH